MGNPQNGAISPVGSAVSDHMAQERATNGRLRTEMDRMQVYREIAGQVILYRTRRHLTQAELAQRVGTSESAIARLESGQHKPSMETLRRIAAALDLRLHVRFEPRVGQELATAS